jgi:CspA family cold shock protein
MQTGTVVTFSPERGFGFLDVGPGKPQIFVHFSSVNCEGYKKLDKGQRVQFEMGIAPNGKPQAVNVTVIDPEKAEDEQWNRL